MVLLSKINAIVCSFLVYTSTGTILRGQPAVTPVAAKTPKSTPPAKVTAVAKKDKDKDDAETLEALGKGLQTIHNLRSLFAKNSDAPASEKFANGALSEELSNKDSQVWATIENMIGETKTAMSSIKGKSKEDRAKVMASLEDKLNNKANVLSNVTDSVSKKQEEQDEEYLLGLLNLHAKDWSVDKQLNATQTFMHNSPLLKKFYEQHDASKPLAAQLAAMMDAKSKETPKAAPKPAAAKDAPKATPEKKQKVAKAASAAARALFIQLASTVTSQDCPYCAAQCVDKCHQAGKPYVQCLTDCADAGK